MFSTILDTPEIIILNQMASLIGGIKKFFDSKHTATNE